MTPVVEWCLWTCWNRRLKIEWRYHSHIKIRTDWTGWLPCLLLSLIDLVTGLWPSCPSCCCVFFATACFLSATFVMSPKAVLLAFGASFTGLWLTNLFWPATPGSSNTYVTSITSTNRLQTNVWLTLFPLPWLTDRLVIRPGILIYDILIVNMEY